MRLFVFSFILTSLFAPAVAGFEIEDHRRFGAQDAAQVLRVISTTDTAILAPLIEAYSRANPDVAVDYTVASSTELVKAVMNSGDRFDLALSSAMDLQTKLSNDGLTQPHHSVATELAPAWGNWRNHVFAFTQEPATIVLSPAAFDGLELPRSRQDLVDILRAYPDRFNGRIGTYDIRLSGAGYLFATQDARTSESYWRLMEIFGGLKVKLFCCSGRMIDQVARGDLAVAYNVVGSYARARDDLEGRITVVEPEDYTNMMLRTAVILKGTQDAGLSGRFVDHLLQAAWGSPVAPEYPFQHFPHGAEAQAGSLRPIQLGPGLLVFLDQLKRKRFLAEWESAVIQK